MRITPIKLLIVDDDQGCILAMRMLLQSYCELYTTTDPQETLSLIKKHNITVVFLDIHMPKKNGLSVLKDIKKERPDVPVIMYTGHAEISAVVDYVRQGAFSYLVKGESSKAELLETLKKASQESKLIHHQTVSEQTSFRPFIGQNKDIVAIYEQAKKIAPAKNISILIRGETGVGKEYLARYIHANSQHGPDAPFVAVNCGAIPESLIESDLFGHEKGAFTDAVEKKIGKFERAQGGTLFLDEIGTMSPELQVRLLRVLQERVIERVGGSQEIPIQIRVIAATNAPLEKAMKDGRFREDLYYRLNGVELEIPSLRNRRSDIGALLQFYSNEHAKNYQCSPKKIAKELVEILKLYNWPGNLRELHNFSEIMTFLLADESQITVQNLPKEWALKLFVKYQEFKTKPLSVRQAMIQKISEAFYGNISATAEFLGIDRTTIYRILEDA